MILLGLQYKDKDVNLIYIETEWLWVGRSNLLYFDSVSIVPDDRISHFSP